MNRRHTAHHARRGVLVLAAVATIIIGAVIATTVATDHDAAPSATALSPPPVAAIPAQPAPPPMPVSAEHNMADSMATPAGQAAAAASERVTRDRAAAASLPAAAALQARLDQAGQPLLFGPDTATLTPEGRARLAQVVDVLRSSPTARVEIVGHTAVEIANPPLCLQLSQLRAELVATRLAAAGIDPDRVTAVGVSHTQPLPTAATSRRAEVIAVAG